MSGKTRYIAVLLREACEVSAKKYGILNKKQLRNMTPMEFHYAYAA